MTNTFTVRLFTPGGDPDGIKIINKDKSNMGLEITLDNSTADIRVFEIEEKLADQSSIQDTIVVPAHVGGFQDVFIGKGCWPDQRIAPNRLKEIKYIAAYQTAPVSAITHVAKVKSIIPCNDDGKRFQLNFAGVPKEIEPITFKGFSSVFLRCTRYTSYNKLAAASEMSELFA